MKDLQFETKALHAGYAPLNEGNIFPSIHIGVAFPFPDGETAEMICAGEIRKPVYARPTSSPADPAKYAGQAAGFAARESGAFCQKWHDNGSVVLPAPPLPLSQTVGPRTWLEELHYQRRDRVLIAAGIVLLAASLTLLMFGYGGFWVPEALLRLAGG